MLAAPPRPHRWSREAYEQVVAAGILRPEDRVQLIEGEIIAMSPGNRPHSLALYRTSETIRELLPPGMHMETQTSLALGDHSEPEPDVLVLAGAAEDYRESHPASALLVVEISDSSLSLDRTRKPKLYATHSIGTYWIVNLIERQVEVHTASDGHDYTNVTAHRAGESFTTAVLGGATVAVNDLLP